jgi:hypothetical protein
MAEWKTTMTQEEVIAKVLDPKALKRLSKSPVADVRWYHYVDSLGEDALQVWVILNESLTDADMRYATVEPVERAIHDGLLAAGVRLFPYIRFAKQSDLDQLGLQV